jgi:hypothetical protein
MEGFQKSRDGHKVVQSRDDGATELNCECERIGQCALGFYQSPSSTSTLSLLLAGLRAQTLS